MPLLQKERPAYEVALLAEGVDRNSPSRCRCSRQSGSPSSRRAWIEIDRGMRGNWKFMSPSSRRAWIEILLLIGKAERIRVALLAEGVDRNHPRRDRWYRTAGSPSSRRAWIEITQHPQVRSSTSVALLAEGVDRNSAVSITTTNQSKSPSSRRAWIEIGLIPLLQRDLVSPSSRRAWIEIPSAACSCRSCPVALLAEGVDRNASVPAFSASM